MPQTPAQRARATALLRLKEKHAADYERMYDEERTALGLDPITVKQSTSYEALHARLDELEAR